MLIAWTGNYSMPTLIVFNAPQRRLHQNFAMIFLFERTGITAVNRAKNVRR